MELGQPEAEPAWLAAVRGWVESGGALVVLARSGHVDHPHDRSAPYFEGLEFAAQPSPHPDVQLARAAHGAGCVIAVVGSEHLDTDALGHCMDYPGRRQRQGYQAAYQVFGHLAGVPLPGRKGYRP